MNTENRFSRPSLVAFAGLAGFVAAALLLWLGSALAGALSLSFGNALVHLPTLVGGDLIFLIAWFAFWIAIAGLVGMRVTRDRRHAPSPALLSERTKLYGKKSFTLIELLIVIAIIAVLATVVILALNPAEMLRAARDANRVSDLATVNQALNLYQTQVVGGAMGSSSVVYVSVPDPSATSSVGTDCSGIGLASSSLAAGWTYHCAASSTYRNVDGTGWIPVDFKEASFGSPMGSLPVDPVNATSSGLYYAYVVNGDPWELTANMESQKYQMGGSHDVESTDAGQYPDLYEVGTDLSLMPIDYNPSLVGYWKLDEGSGTVAYDSSGHGNNGTWSGTQAGTSGYYSQGLNQTYAGYFDGTDDGVSCGTGVDATLNGSAWTVMAWMNVASFPTSSSLADLWSNTNSGYVASGAYVDFYTGGTKMRFTINTGQSEIDIPYSEVTTSTWNLVTAVLGGNTATFYLNGILMGSQNSSVPSASNSPLGIGYVPSALGRYFNGLIDDVRVFNRALSATEIRAIYNSEK